MYRLMVINVFFTKLYIASINREIVPCIGTPSFDRRELVYSTYEVVFSYHRVVACYNRRYLCTYLSYNRKWRKVIFSRDKLLASLSCLIYFVHNNCYPTFILLRFN
jgi:hypothetical protein